MRINTNALVTFAALLGSACGPAATELVVVVDSDYEVPAPMSRIFVEVFDPRGAPLLARDFDPSAPGVGLPFSFGIEPGPYAGERVEIVIAAAEGTTLLSERRARISFVDDELRLLDVFLASACLDRACEPGTTCGERGCIPIDVDVTTLPEVQPGSEIDLGM